MPHSPLGLGRRGLLAVDVAQAVNELVGDVELPVAITKEDVVRQLEIIASRDEFGNPMRIPAFHREATAALINNRITNTAVFQAGYKRYENETECPVTIVPVTDYFFKFALIGDTVLDALNHMSPFDVLHSLPKRTSIAKYPPGHEYHGEERRAANNELVQFGEVAGIVVFPRGSSQALLYTWLEKRINGAVGVTKKAAQQIIHNRESPELEIKVDRLENQLRGSLIRGLSRGN